MQSASPIDKPILRRDDIHTGLSLVQTIYGIAMVLGLKIAIETSYSLFLSPTESPPSSFPHYIVLFALATIMLLGLRFFWVPRNLYAYLLVSDLPLSSRLRRMTVIHFPITLVHALLFYCVCHAYADIAVSNAALNSSLADALASRFVLFYAGLLLFNGAWLLSVAPSGKSQAESIWGRNNLVAAGLIAVIFAAFKLFAIPTVAFIALAGAVFVLNSAIDLWKASEYYVLFPDAEPEASR